MEHGPIDNPKTISRWRVLALCHLAVFSFAVTLQVIPPLVEALVQDLGMNHAQVGALMGLFTLPGIFLAIPGGHLSDRLGPRRIGLASLSLMALGTFLMAPLTPVPLYAGRFVAGIGGGVLVVICPQIISQRFMGRELGLAMGIFNTAVPLGTILSFNFLGLAYKVMGIRNVILLTGCLTVISLTFFTFAYADVRPKLKGEAIPRPTLRGLGPFIWLIAVIWTLFNVALMAFFTFGIDYFGSCGFSDHIAGLLSSTPMIVSILAVPAVGWLMDRYGWRGGLLAVGGMLCGLTMLLISRYPTGALLWTILLGLGVSMVPPAIFAMAGESVPADKIGLGFGILTTLFNIGLFLGIPLVGSLRDLAGNYQLGFLFMAAALFASSILALYLIWKRRKRSEPKPGH
jgi:MFS family permease